MFYVTLKSETNAFVLNCDTAEAAAEMFKIVKAGQSMRANEAYELKVFHIDEANNITYGQVHEA